MPNSVPKSLANRSILTETLPYEVPVIFSNDRLHSALSATMPLAVQKLWRKIVDLHAKYSIPYNYEIAKDDTRTTTLSIVHPRVQGMIANFYEMHHTSMLSYCSNDRMSLRRPIALASPYVASDTVDEEGKLKLGVAQLLVDEDQPDVSHLPSYFAYGKYNLLSRFFESREFIRLEGRYLKLRTLDISKCFYNIYSHTIGWAVKDKPTAKDFVGSYTFEATFDGLMQQANYNETNGIVVGPEVSRIFAEIILQSVDEKVEATLKHAGLALNRQYDIRRYVDDYFVFANSEDVLNLVESTICRELECYKLYFNDSKNTTTTRPFITPLSLARQEVAALLREVRSALYELLRSPDATTGARHHRRLKGVLSELRYVVSRYNVTYANISGRVMTLLKAVARRAIRALRQEQPGDLRPLVADVVVSMLEQAFYVCAIDLRVRSTYSIAQFCLLIRENAALFSEEQQDLINHVVMDQCSAIIRAYRARSGDKFGHTDTVEIFNLLICGALFVGEDFLRSSEVKMTLEAFMSNNRITYFAFITLKFCYLKDQAQFQAQLDKVNALALERIRAANVDFARDSEEYLMLNDWISSPDIEAKDKRDILNVLFNTNAFGEAGTKELAKWVGFVDWTGLSVHHLLAKKELRPVYAWG